VGVKILVVSPHLPYEGIPHAGGAYLLRHLEQLAAGNEVTLVVPGSPEVQEHLPRRPEWLEVVVAPFTTAGNRWSRIQIDRARRHCRHAALHTPALSGLRAAGLVQLASEADVVELHWGETSMLIRELRAAGVTTPLVAVAHDVHSEAALVRAHRLSNRRGRVAVSLGARVRTRLERVDLDAADLVLVFKAADVVLLRSMRVRTRVRVLDPHLELPEGPTPARAASSVLFTGAMWRPENHRGVEWFLRSVWPGVRAEVPGATFTIVGASPPIALRRLAEAAGGVVVTGEVPDLAPFYEFAQAFVAPLFVPGGLKFKVVQALAYGLPVVATPTAAAGVVEEAPEGTFWAVTAYPGEMQAALVGLLRDPSAAAAVGTRAAAWCRDRYSFSRSMADLVAAYQDLAAR
jgi:glycosyltransferase involved in cell wall biosynthesis